MLYTFGNTQRHNYINTENWRWSLTDIWEINNNVSL